jgi:hypothetical protein
MPVLPGESREMAKRVGKEEDMGGMVFMCDCPPKSTWKWGGFMREKVDLQRQTLLFDLI